MFRRSLFFKVLAAIFLLAVTAGGAFAQNASILDAPRVAGQIGERYDGYAVVRDQDNVMSLAPLVGSVNAERRKIYNERALKENVPVDQIGRVYATEIFRRAPAGTWFLGDNGQWTRK